MGLTQAQKTTIQRVKTAGGGTLGVSLKDAECSYLLAVIARDLGLQDKLPELLQQPFPEFFEEPDIEKLILPDVPFQRSVEQLFMLVDDADTYFQCLGTLYKSRLKYSRILEYQPLPTMDQIGPRALLQYGQMSADNLAAWMFWRKWIYDIDNRAAQETGYLFQPIIASAIGGASFSSRTSPIRRRQDVSKGRQVDCIRDQLAYEIKIRVTIAASGQGRWREELDFPTDCRFSGYTPVLVVLDPTPNPKLDELVRSFQAQGGDAYIGDAAWAHFEQAAGPVMAVLLEKYVRKPLESVFDAAPAALPDLLLRMEQDHFTVEINGVKSSFRRSASSILSEAENTVQVLFDSEQESL